MVDKVSYCICTLLMENAEPNLHRLKATTYIQMQLIV